MSEHAPIPCSVLVLTRNSAGSLARCLAPLAPFSEILVHDANSIDDTVMIAKEFGARVLPQYPDDTVTPSLRVKDFTEMRLRQRADAKEDWVLYVDSDEELSPEAVQEIADLLPDLDPKTIIKIPRIPVIGGVPRTRGHLTPDIMPRIHNRKSGATLQKGKTVHEKYEYDSSFKEITLKHPLYTPLPDVADMRAKDDRYLLLEVRRLRDSGYTWGEYVRWILFREPLIMLMLLVRIARIWPELGKPDSIPLDHHLRYVRYHWRLFRGITGMMLGFGKKKA
ncbi:MAG TPA: glycosyltransferase [Candidatus Peribacteria bacterium]|nr:glycosyltransferase [Candidatus Peribacteria bacterium]